MFFLIGPPTVPPNWLLISFGWAELRLLKYGYAFKCWFMWYWKAEPWTWFVPDLICRLIAAPPARPCSASKEFVTTFTVSIDSSAGL